MSASNSFEAALCALIFNGTAIANIADNAGSSPATTLYVSLHTADPGEGGTQASSEAAHTGYARVAVARNSGGWTCSGSSAVNTAIIQYALTTGGTIANITHVGVGLASTGSGTLLGSLELDSPINMAVGATPRFNAGDLEFTVD